jgi:hypothetical protein
MEFPYSQFPTLYSPYRSFPLATTGNVPMISSPRTITTSSIMLTTTQTWFGTISTTSPTLGRVLLDQRPPLLPKARHKAEGLAPLPSIMIFS